MGHANPARWTLMAAAAPAALLGAAPAWAQDDRIVVTASRGGQPIAQVGSAISVLDAETIELEQITTLDEALERVPGVAVTRSGGAGQDTQLRMRGFTTKHVLTMVDGVKLNNPSEASSEFGPEHLLLNTVERIEVLRGPQSGVYGADAVAGVINIITRRPQGPLSGRVSAMTGSHDTYELSASAEGGSETFGMLGSVSWFETESISLSSRPPGNVEPDGYENLTATGRAEWSPTQNFRASAWLRYVDARNEIDAGSLPADNPAGLPGFLFQDSPGYTDNQQLFGAVTAELDMLDGALTHNLQLSRVELDSTYIAPGTEQNSEGTTTEAAYFGRYALGGESSVLAGGEIRREEGRFEQPQGFGFALADDAIENRAVFAEADIELAQGLYVSGALRHDDNERFGGETTWRATGAWNLPAGVGPDRLQTKLRASYGEGAEAPGLRQLLGSSATFRGNPDLQPESSWMFDIGLDQQLDGGLAAWSLTYYQGEADDGVFYVSVENPASPGAFYSTPQNADSPVEMRGVEADLTLAPAPWIEFRAAYTHNIVELKSAGTQLFGRPKHEGSAAVTVRPAPDLAVTLDGYWRGDFFSDYPSTYEMDGYGLYNLSAVWDVSEQVQIAARVGNLFDEIYEEKLGDSTYGRTAQIRLTLRQ